MCGLGLGATEEIKCCMMTCIIPLLMTMGPASHF